MRRTSSRTCGSSIGSAVEVFGDTRFLTRQPEVYIAFPRSTLSLAQYPHTGDGRPSFRHTMEPRSEA
jgi:hypothetical protein